MADERQREETPGPANGAKGERSSAGGSKPARGEQARTSGAAAAPAGPATAVLADRRPLSQTAVTRRGVLRIGFWTSMGAIVAGAVGSSLGLIWPKRVQGFGGKISAGEVSQYPPGSKTAIAEGRCYLVHLTEEQGGPGLLALWWKCPHLGCTVPWKDKFVWPDPTTGTPKEGWFRCPCHGSTFTDAGILVFGPAPRPMDTMKLTVENRRISIDTGDITPGGPDNKQRVLPT